MWSYRQLLQMQVRDLNVGKFTSWWVVLFVIGIIVFPFSTSDRTLAVILLLLAVGLILVIYGTLRKNGMGINFEQVNCPRCKQPMPQVREPESIFQALWGGGRCQHCGCDMDKWGREIVSRD